MVYRKTALVHAKGKAKREAIIAATIDVIAREGISKLSTRAVADRAESAEGSIYAYFADKTELLAAATAQVLAADLSAMREAGELAASLMALYARFESPHLVRAMMDMPAYREGIRDALVGLIKAPPVGRGQRKIAAAAILAVINAVFESMGPNGAEIAAGYSLRMLGMKDAAIARALGE